MNARPTPKRLEDSPTFVGYTNAPVHPGAFFFAHNARMTIFLLKSEPDDYSYADLVRDGSSSGKLISRCVGLDVLISDVYAMEVTFSSSPCLGHPSGWASIGFCNCALAL